MSRWSKSVKFLCLLLCGGFTFLTTTARAKPTLSFQLPPSLTNLAPFPGISRFVERRIQNDQMKTYTNDDEGAKLLKELSAVNRPLQIDFREMLKLMMQCQMIDHMRKVKRQGTTSDTDQTTKRQHQTGYFSGAGLSLFSGIIPGTKWCGTGDIATTYHDLGTEAPMDMCCRTHDLCPVKVRAYQKRYNLNNNSLYTK
uniref:phospholipase A2 n=1 Tax=Phlebotomus papatasi TaxID=29031 RepID=A0A1B0D9R1_PHLPP